LSAAVDDVAIYGEALSEEEVESHLADSEAPPPATILMPPLETEDWMKTASRMKLTTARKLPTPNKKTAISTGLGTPARKNPTPTATG